MTVRVRFAPSPTGLLHVGNIRTALITWLFARKHKGWFLFRLDDTDLERSKEEYATAIAQDLRWLGLDWDAQARQSTRIADYDTAVERLKASGRIYPCYETEEELALKRKSLLGRGLPPLYDRAALKLTDEQKKKFDDQGLKPHWRFLLDHKPIEWNDLIRGPVRFEGKDLSDPVVIREDGSYLYHICSVIDDVDFRITHIVRGEDHVTNTAYHAQMFEALGVKPPEFAHLPLIAGAEGEKLSKRIGSLSARNLRDEMGLEPMAVASLLARLGTSEPIEPFTAIQPLIDSFDFSKFSRATPKLDEEDLKRLNRRILNELPLSEVKPRLDAMGLEKIDEPFWLAVRPNLERLADIREWWDVARGNVEPAVHDAEFMSKAAELLPNTPWDDKTWNRWIEAVKTGTNRKGKELFMPLRCALTGKEHGPELKDLLPLIGRERTLERLKAAS